MKYEYSLQVIRMRHDKNNYVYLLLNNLTLAKVVCSVH